MPLGESYNLITHATFVGVYGTLIEFRDGIAEQFGCSAFTFTIAHPDVVTAARQDVIVARSVLKTDCREAAVFLG